MQYLSAEALIGQLTRPFTLATDRGRNSPKADKDTIDLAALKLGKASQTQLMVLALMRTSAQGQFVLQLNTEMNSPLPASCCVSILRRVFCKD